MTLMTVKSGALPIGSYEAAFEGTEPVEADDSRGFGPAIRWRWRITAGPHAGQTVSRYTGATPTPLNACGKILSGLTGRSLAQGESVDPDQFLGRRYNVMLGTGREGGTRVEALAPLSA